MSCSEMKTTEFKLTLIAEHAKRDKNMKFMSLAHLLSAEFLKDGFNSLNRNKAVGIDEVSWHDYNVNLDSNIELLLKKLKKKSFRPIPARRVYIQKDDGRKRTLGISSIENKIVELGVKRILEGIYEQDFSEQSFGFRPKRSCHDALKATNRLITFNPVNHLVEADIKGFCKIVRYVDDFICVVQFKDDAINIEKALKNRCMKNIQNMWSILASKLRGHYQYYGVSENSKSISTFYYLTIRAIFKWLNRRSQRKSMNWKSFNKYLVHYPLPKPEIKCSFYT